MPIPLLHLRRGVRIALEAEAGNFRLLRSLMKEALLVAFIVAAGSSVLTLVLQGSVPDVAEAAATPRLRADPAASSR